MICDGRNNWSAHGHGSRVSLQRGEKLTSGFGYVIKSHSRNTLTFDGLLCIVMCSLSRIETCIQLPRHRNFADENVFFSVYYINILLDHAEQLYHNVSSIHYICEIQQSE